MIKAPKHLSPVAREHFERVVALLIDNKSVAVSSLDTDVIASYASCCAQIEKLEQEIDKIGLLVDTPKGKIANPLIRAQRQAVTLQTMLARQLGLTPSSRGEVKKSKSELDDSLFPED